MRKVILLFFILPFLPTFFWAQSLESQLVQAEFLEFDFRHAPATALADSILQVLEKSNLSAQERRWWLRAHLIKATAHERHARYALLDKELLLLEPYTARLEECDTLKWSYYTLKAAYLIDISDAQQGIALLKKVNPSLCPGNTSMILADWYDLLGLTQARAGNLEQGLVNFEQALKIREQHRLHCPLATTKSLRMISGVYKQRGDYATALAYLGKATDIADQNQGTPMLYASLYYLYALIYENKRDVQTALSYAERSYNLVAAMDKPAPGLLFEVYSVYAQAYRSIDSMRLAYIYYGKSRAVLDENPDDIGLVERPMFLINLARWYNDIGDYQSGIATARSAIRTVEPIVSKGLEFPFFWIKSYEAIANSYYYMADYERAIQVYDTIFEGAKQWFPSNHALLFESKHNSALCLDGLGKHKESIQIYTDAMASLNANNNQFNTWLDPISASYALWNRATAYESMGKAQGDKNLLKKSLEDLATYLDFVDFLRSSYREEGSQTLLMGENRVAYQKALEVLATYHAPQMDYKKCYDWMERCKSLQLLMNFNKHQSDSLLPELYKGQLKSLEWRLKEAERVVFSLQTARKQPEAVTIDSAKQVWFEAQKQFNQFLEELQKARPDYFDARYASTPLSFEELNKILVKEKTSMVSYFTTDTMLFILASNGKEQVYHQERLQQPLNQLVADLRFGITGFYTDEATWGEHYDSLSKVYLRSAYQLNQLLIDPFKRILGSKVLVIPDENLADLPFEALLSASVSSVENWGDLPYLLDKYQINYAYSATLWHKMKIRHGKNSQTKRKPIFAVAASEVLTKVTIGGQTYIFDPLLKSEEEASATFNLFGKKGLLLKKAQEQAVAIAIGDYQIVHISTHAFIISDKGSFLLFTPIDDDQENELMFVSEIYRLNVRADLITLSACETNLGQVAWGEGLISVSRAFAYAGASGIFASLWSVDENKTMDMMLQFYSMIANAQKSKGEAITLSKRTMAHQTKDKTANHPYFWAGFVGIGDMR